MYDWDMTWNKERIMKKTESYYDLLWESNLREGLKQQEIKRRQIIENGKYYVNVAIQKFLDDNFLPSGDIEHKTILKELLEEIDNEK